MKLEVQVNIQLNMGICDIITLDAQKIINFE